MTADDAKQALAGAKEMISAGDFPAALKLLRRCAGYGERDAASCNKLAKAAAKLSGKCGLRRLKIALLSSSTTVFLEPLLKYFLLCRGVDAVNLSTHQSGGFIGACIGLYATNNN